MDGFEIFRHFVAFSSKLTLIYLFVHTYNIKSGIAY